MDKNLIKQFNHFKIHSQYSICQGAIKINDLKQLNDILKKSFDKDENTLVFTIYGSQNQRRYIGIKLK